MYNRIVNFQNDPSWQQSLGERFWDYNFRNGHYHAVCNSTTGYCSTHYDEHDPHESLQSLASHLLGNKWVQLMLAVGLIDQVANGGKLRKSLTRSLFG